MTIISLFKDRRVLVQTFLPKQYAAQLKCIARKRMNSWETYELKARKNRTSKYLVAGKFVLIILLAEKKQVIAGNLLTREFLLESWNSYFLHSKFRNSIADLLW